MREIVFDTETTGLDPANGHRVVEIGCIEILNAIPTGQHFHVYIDPERDMPEEAFRVHGISAEFLKGKQVFAQIAEDFLKFVGDGQLVAHNAEFDMRFINAELALLGLPPIGSDRVIDTLTMARRRHPGSPNNLDALCQRYGIDNSRRTKHGALLDAEILAEVYAELTGGRQANLLLGGPNRGFDRSAEGLMKARPEPLPFAIEAMATLRHWAFIKTLGDKAIWHQFKLPEPPSDP
ncbi:DNA polymerase III subunit epsilon [Methyloferula stellata]|uniref:DNA polymerase III subunit epsilon n=1 Tax=Methyloferula stellata TaxID=876270 RepID=UPI0003749B92|nr:DNA polymerase III subunit epsilon [Methyloferula stellata]